jgi:hypothetical protein
MSTQTATDKTPSPSDESFSLPCFTIANLAVLYDSKIAVGFSNNEHQVVARALLRYNSHLDGTYYQTRVLHGLHPAYVEFNPAPAEAEDSALTNPDLVEALLGDLFDTASGFSDLIHLCK